jgi:cell wall-associated NlpC family hydrolase
MAGLALAALVAAPTAGAASHNGGAGIPPPLPSGGTPIGPVPPAPVPGAVAQLAADGRSAVAPAAAPEPVKKAIAAANRITSKPYRYGGGHRRFNDRGYDCSGAISYALRGGALLASPLDSRAFRRWGAAGRGQWITVYTNPGHAYVVIAGLRFDTSGPGERGPRWRGAARSSRGYTARHPEGL